MSLRLTFKTLVAIACCVMLPGCVSWKPWGSKSATPGSTAVASAEAEEAERLQGLIDAPADAKPEPKRSMKLAWPFFGSREKEDASAPATVAKPGSARQPQREQPAATLASKPAEINKSMPAAPPIGSGAPHPAAATSQPGTARAPAAAPSQWRQAAPPNMAANAAPAPHAFSAPPLANGPGAAPLTTVPPMQLGQQAEPVAHRQPPMQGSPAAMPHAPAAMQQRQAFAQPHPQAQPHPHPHAQPRPEPTFVPRPEPQFTSRPETTSASRPDAPIQNARRPDSVAPETLDDWRPVGPSLAKKPVKRPHIMAHVPTAAELRHQTPVESPELAEGVAVEPVKPIVVAARPKPIAAESQPVAIAAKPVAAEPKPIAATTQAKPVSRPTVANAIDWEKLNAPVSNDVRAKFAAAVAARSNAAPAVKPATVPPIENASEINSTAPPKAAVARISSRPDDDANTSKAAPEKPSPQVSALASAMNAEAQATRVQAAPEQRSPISKPAASAPPKVTAAVPSTTEAPEMKSAFVLRTPAARTAADESNDDRAEPAVIPTPKPAPTPPAPAAVATTETSPLPNAAMVKPAAQVANTAARIEKPNASMKSAFQPRIAAEPATDASAPVAMAPGQVPDAETPKVVSQEPAVVTAEVVRPTPIAPVVETNPAPAEMTRETTPTSKPNFALTRPHQSSTPPSLKSAFQPPAATPETVAATKSAGKSQWAPRAAAPELPAPVSNEPELTESPYKAAESPSAKIASALPSLGSPPASATPAAEPVAPSPVSFAPTRFVMAPALPPAESVATPPAQPPAVKESEAEDNAQLGTLAKSITLAPHSRGSRYPRTTEPAAPEAVASAPRTPSMPVAAEIVPAKPIDVSRPAVASATPAREEPPAVAEMIIMPKAPVATRKSSIVMEAPEEVGRELPKIVSVDDYQSRHAPPAPQPAKTVPMRQATPVEPMEPASGAPVIDAEEYARQRPKAGLQGFITTSAPLPRDTAPVMSPQEFERRKAVRRR